MPSLKLELRTWRHFDDATEMIEDGGPLREDTTAKKSGGEEEGEGEGRGFGHCRRRALQLWLLLLLWCAIQGGLSSYIVQRDESDDLYA